MFLVSVVFVALIRTCVLLHYCPLYYSVAMGSDFSVPVCMYVYVCMYGKEGIHVFWAVLTSNLPPKLASFTRIVATLIVLSGTLW